MGNKSACPLTAHGLENLGLSLRVIDPPLYKEYIWRGTSSFRVVVRISESVTGPCCIHAGDDMTS